MSMMCIYLAGVPLELSRVSASPDLSRERVSASPGGEHVYEVSGRLILPQHGKQTFRCRVRLMEVAPEVDLERGKEATRVVRMVVEDSESFDAHGRTQMTDPLVDMQLQPVYYWQGSDGGIQSVAHHGSEDTRVVGAKKALIAAHQLPLDLSRAAKQWEVNETDAVGASSSVYEIVRSQRRLLPVRSKRRLLEKRQVYAESSAVPAAFRYEANSTILLDERGVPASIQQRAFFRPRHVDEMVAGSTGTIKGSKRLAELDGFDVLPQEPHEVCVVARGAASGWVDGPCHGFRGGGEVGRWGGWEG